MKTSKVLVSLALAGVLGTSLYAGNGYSKEMKDGKSCKMQGKSMKKGMYKKGKRGPLAILKKLNLTQEQETQISKIKEDIMSKRVTADVAFTKEGFDKAKFVEIMKQKRENMIESKAEMIDRVYKVLTPKQKEQFKVLMELKKERRITKG